MKIHREGHHLLLISLLVLVVFNLLLSRLLGPGITTLAVGVISALIWLFMLSFFRYPARSIPEIGENLIYAPADGKVVVVEEAEEAEFFKGKRLQVSIFMSPANVHVNWVPMSGEVRHFCYHPGRYLVAWHPKSSEENEKTCVVIDNGQTEVLLRQIAGALARRIKTYVHVGDTVQQGEELGFIKFGSRVDLFLPLRSELNVRIGDTVKGNRTVIARLPETKSTPIRQELFPSTTDGNKV